MLVLIPNKHVELKDIKKKSQICYNMFYSKPLLGYNHWLRFFFLLYCIKHKMWSVSKWLKTIASGLLGVTTDTQFTVQYWTDCRNIWKWFLYLHFHVIVCNHFQMRIFTFSVDCGKHLPRFVSAVLVSHLIPASVNIKLIQHYHFINKSDWMSRCS